MSARPPNRGRSPSSAPRRPCAARSTPGCRPSTPLDQEFNSLDNRARRQRPYIRSQAHEGWRPLPAHYDDGGFSGGSLERPALQRLLAEVRARRVDVIVVYKVDRLSRALSDSPAGRAVRRVWRVVRVGDPGVQHHTSRAA